MIESKKKFSGFSVHSLPRAPPKKTSFVTPAAKRLLNDIATPSTPMPPLYVIAFYRKRE
jgi:hypothetical protein